MACDQGLKELPELKILIKKLLTEVDALKNSTSQNLKKESDYEFVISDINERNRREANLICNNVTESDSNQSEARIVYDRDQITTDIYKKIDNEWIKNNYISRPKASLCIEILADFLVFPVVHKVTRISDHCPIIQGRYVIQMSKIHTKHHPVVPFGCWKFIIEVEKSETKHYEKVCGVVNSINSMKSNNTIKCD
ncbi:uncharacterized protein LOC126905527 isoform X2 [Daktulosphaira vitifoliae]|uniref:uncharacterized protein LOC126905527 isoform X2 n=1 Tax=Daktulosphaira vitifoliae TaxID=58002 RepID=UPI0021AAF8EB|nr:uncharacterized protein LOC126905527 isoform X2 [Daktulosphaira vitifoliae]